MITIKSGDRQMNFAKVNEFNGKVSLQTTYSITDLKDMIQAAEDSNKNTVSLSVPCEVVDGLTVKVRLQEPKSEQYKPSVAVFHNFLLWNYKKK